MPAIGPVDTAVWFKASFRQRIELITTGKDRYSALNPPPTPAVVLLSIVQCTILAEAASTHATPPPEVVAKLYWIKQFSMSGSAKFLM
jgi:hypothetical protein